MQTSNYLTVQIETNGLYQNNNIKNFLRLGFSDHLNCAAYDKVEQKCAYLTSQFNPNLEHSLLTCFYQ
ncbi:UNVERIFIED_CONTAM: hypothetical protein FKN15_000782 [Acipenser sinensis]